MSGAEAARCPVTSTAERDKREISDISFDVYVSNGVPDGINVDRLNPPGKTPNPFARSLAAYKLLEVNDINRAKEIIKTLFTYRTITRLRNLGIVEANCKRLAELIMDGKEVRINADVDELHLEDIEDIYEFYRYKNTVESYQCLLISAPEIGNEDDSRKRKQEMEKFCLQAFPSEHFAEARLNKMIVWRKVENNEHVKTFIQDFFSRPDGIRAKRALHAMIVFFGHGSVQGFCVGQQNMPLNDIISLVKAEWNEALLRTPEELPVKVEIIFTQCHGHLYGGVDQSNRFTVTALTTSDHPLTTSSPDAAGRFANDNLTPYCHFTVRPAVSDMETWRQSDNSNIVDLSVARSRYSRDAEPAPLTREDSSIVAEVSDGEPPSTSFLGENR